MRCIFDMVINTPIPWKIFSRFKFSHEQFEKLIRIHYLNISVYYFSYISSLVFFYICHILHIHSFIHSFIYSFIHPSIHSFSHSFIHSFSHSFIQSLLYLMKIILKVIHVFIIKRPFVSKKQVNIPKFVNTFSQSKLI